MKPVTFDLFWASIGLLCLYDAAFQPTAKLGWYACAAFALYLALRQRRDPPLGV